MKKIISVLIVLTMCVCLFTGCGGKGSSGKIRIVVPDRMLTKVGINAFISQKQQEFDKKYGNEIEVVHILPTTSSDVNDVQNLSALLLSNDAPSYVTVSSTIYMKDLYNMGLVKDISSLVKNNKTFEKLMDRTVDACKYHDGKIIGYPVSIEVPLLGFYNSALTEAGYDPNSFTCETWDDYYNMAKKMNNSSHSGASIYASEFYLWPNNWFLANGAQVAKQNNDGTISLNYTDNKVIETVSFLKKLYSEGLTNKNIGFSDIDNMFTLLYQKQVASFTMYPTWISRFVNAGVNPNEITLRKFPKGPSGEYSSAMYVSCVVLNSKLTDEEAEATIKYLDFMNSEDYLNEYFAYCKEKSISELKIPCMDNIDWSSSLTDFPQSWIDVIKSAISTAEDTSLDSTGHATYISASLPEIISNSKVDVKSGMQQAEDLTKKEWLNDYNKNAKK